MLLVQGTFLPETRERFGPIFYFFEKIKMHHERTQWAIRTEKEPLDVDSLQGSVQPVVFEDGAQGIVKKAYESRTSLIEKMCLRDILKKYRCASPPPQRNKCCAHFCAIAPEEPGGDPRRMVICPLLLPWKEAVVRPDFSAEDVLHLSKSLLEAVRCLHAAGWAHGDLHEDNWMVDHQPGQLTPPRAVLIDFGLSMRQEPTGLFLGLQYMDIMNLMACLAALWLRFLRWRDTHALGLSRREVQVLRFLAKDLKRKKDAEMNRPDSPPLTVEYLESLLSLPLQFLKNVEDEFASRGRRGHFRRVGRRVRMRTARGT